MCVNPNDLLLLLRLLDIETGKLSHDTSFSI